MARRSVLILFIQFFISHTLSQNSDPIVKTEYGMLSGSWKKSTGGRDYAAFEGIPFGASTAGTARLQDPMKPQPWSGVRKAVAPGSPCLQYNVFIPDPANRVMGSEDCLFLNVFTPNLNPSTPMAVIAYIHGGAFMFGSADQYGAFNMMDRDIVFVTMNYRLGPLGFLSTEDENIAGNMGLKDQNLALKWVQENIKDFGGNPGNVMLIGHSAGAASAHYHILSDFSKGMFHKAALASASAFEPWAVQVNPFQKAKAVAAHLGCPTDTTKMIGDCLRMKPAEAIVQAQDIFFAWTQNWFSPFSPSVESPKVKGHIVSEHPYLIAKRGMSQKIPIMMSGTSAEGCFPGAAYIPSSLGDLDARWNQLASYVFMYNDTMPPSRHAEVAEKIRRRFLEENQLDEMTFPKLAQAMSQRLYLAAIGKGAELHAATTGQPTYLYYYSFRGSTSVTELLTGRTDDFGASHGDDFFHMISFILQFTSPEDIEITNMLLDFYYSFATKGVPSSPGVTWQPLTPGSQEINYLSIKSPSKVKMLKTSNFGRRKFWDSLGFMENENIV